MDGGVGGVIELLGHPGVRGLFQNLLGACDGTFHAFGSRRQDKLRSQHGEEGTAFDTHRLGHGEDELVALGRCHEGEGDAGVAAGGLDDGGSLLDQTLRLGISDHGGTDTILHAPEWIEELALHGDRRREILGDAIKAYEGCVSDRIDDGVVHVSHKIGGIRVRVFEGLKF